MAEQVDADQRTRSVPRSRYILTTVVVATTAGLDQITKAFIVARFSVGQSAEIIPGLFNLCYTQNTGVVFGLFQGMSWLFAVLTFAAIVILALLVRALEDTASRIQYLAYGLIMGGAIGNLIDRVRVGSVTDFLDFYIGRHHWPAFNIADSAVCIGVTVLLLDALAIHRSTEPDAAS